MGGERLPTVADVNAAAGRLAGVAVSTPLFESPALNDLVGCRLFAKAETFQRGGAYKFRGAYNRLSQLTHAERRRGVVAWSSGNHGIAVSLASRLLGIKAMVIMPADVPGAKRDAVAANGSEIIFYDRYSEDRELIARRLCDERGATLVPSYDDPHIIAGQGTVAREVFAQVEAAGAGIDTLVVPCGGGGLAAGTCLVSAAQARPVRVVAVEPAASDDTRRSLEKGARVCLPRESMRTICDALALPEPGALTFAINRALLAGVATVDDAEVAAAMRIAFDMLKLVLEPGAAVGLAALLNGRVAHDGSVAVILSGANVDRRKFCDLVCPPQIGASGTGLPHGGDG